MGEEIDKTGGLLIFTWNLDGGLLFCACNLDGELLTLTWNLDGGLLHLDWNLEVEGGDLIKNLCGVPLFLDITGDLVLQNLCCCEEDVDMNKGLGNNTAFLAQGLFLGDTLFAIYLLLSLSNSLTFWGETLKLILERALPSVGDFDSDRAESNLACFSLFLLALSWVFSGLCNLWGVLCGGPGVLGSSVSVFLATAETISLAN